MTGDGCAMMPPPPRSSHALPSGNAVGGRMRCPSSSLVQGASSVGDNAARRDAGRPSAALVDPDVDDAWQSVERLRQACSRPICTASAASPLSRHYMPIEGLER